MLATPPAARPLLHPLQALLLAFPVALFTGALLADIAYLNSAEVQWTNFAAWLNAGALVGGGFALLWALIDLVRFRRTRSRSRAGIYAGLLAIMWGAGLINAFQHSKDGWSSVGTAGLILSIISAALAIAAGWIAHSGRRSA
ncbi:DUF2231 domain-containing protein [Sphingomonas montanisoli]|uniref:DUF2231 domain-containing protein n=1 Tax=Sphingomonas montanisoli TaxID=2606412 RepID=A0A5D9CD48_9SPHN|nr:DUF2231 domain-containing protein [Sphingomonas montanisoli]TZG29594.1 hypothetical protein FYJ91_05605 [Sphingomonas montanisoli]